MRRGLATAATEAVYALYGGGMGNAVYELVGGRSGRQAEGAASFESTAGDLNTGLREQMSRKARQGQCP
ncbi:MAG: hypothetical protein ACOC9T_03435 [Myxococcota bacterium]